MKFRLLSQQNITNVDQGCIFHPWPLDISSIDSWNLANLGWDLATFSILNYYLRLLIGKLCFFVTFPNPSLQLTKLCRSKLNTSSESVQMTSPSNGCELGKWSAVTVLTCILPSAVLSSFARLYLRSARTWKLRMSLEYSHFRYWNANLKLGCTNETVISSRVVISLSAQ